jgi:peroxidase
LSIKFNSKPCFSADPFASDLIAINIQRGRDHGIPNYNAMRSLVGLGPIRDMTTRPAEISAVNWGLLAHIYSSPNDIDLYTGGLAEDKADGEYNDVIKSFFSLLHL